MSNIKALTEKIKKFRDERDWMQFHNHKDVALSLVLEAAEVLEHFQWKKPGEVEAHGKACKDEIADQISQRIIELFDKTIPEFYSPEDRAAGYITGKDRQGNETKTGLMSISIGIVSNAFQKISHVAEISEIGAELKKYAKAQEISNFVRDKRKA